MDPDSASAARGTHGGLGPCVEPIRLASQMARIPDPDAPKRANVGPRRAAEPLETRSSRYRIPLEESGIDRLSPGLAESRTGVLSFLYVRFGDWTENGAPAGTEFEAVFSDLGLVIRNEVTNHQGSDVATEQEGFLAVFSSPSSSVAAALDVRRTINTRSWPRGDVIRVRMGLHTGESKDTVDGVLSLDALRAKEIAAVSHAGQIVLSGATAALLANSMPEGIRLDDLGVHRLRDLGHPERLFQVEEEGLRPDFPLLRSLDNPVMLHNLPERLSSFVGRERELRQVRELLLSDRLVTLIGPGGAGKTRLALQVAAELLDGDGDGVWLVELAGLSDPENVATAVAGALSIQPEAGRSISGVSRRLPQTAAPSLGS